MNKVISSYMHNVIEATWPMILVSVVVLVTLRIIYVIKNREHLVLYKELFYLSFIIYILSLFQIVTTSDLNTLSGNNFIPFKEILRYDLGSRLFIKNVIGNILLFLPFGFFVSFILKSDSIFEIIDISIITSVTIECVQMVIGRVFDIDDILLNLIGGILGWSIYLLLSRFYDKLPKIIKKEAILDIIALFVLVGVIFIVIGWFMIEINNLVNEKIKELDDVKKVISLAMKKEDIDASLNIIIVDNEYIHKINKEYRNKDTETDVISFALEDDDSLVLPDGIRILGDIYISIDKAKEQAKLYGHSLKREICFLAVHGFYHLLGYDHMSKEDEEIMFKKQEEVLEEYGITR